MIVLRSTYTAPLDQVDALREAHVAWINGHVEAGTILGAGRMEPPTGAIVLVAGSDGESALATFAEDPYVTGGVAEYELLAQFTPGAAAPEIKRLDGLAG